MKFEILWSESHQAYKWYEDTQSNSMIPLLPHLLLRIIITGFLMFIHLIPHTNLASPAGNQTGMF